MKIINDLYLDLAAFKPAFHSARPFPHVVLDDFLDPAFFSQLCEVTQAERKTGSGRKFDTQHEKSKWISINDSLPEMLASLIDALNDERWVANLASLSDIPGLVSTQCGNSQLGNYHLMEPGGFLAPHVDHASEPETGLPHVLNIILYLSEEWDEAYGGSTTFYDSKGKRLVSEVKYRPNRAVIFMHTPYSFHCVEEIQADIPLPRKTLYVDYYSQSFNPYVNLKLPFPNRWFYHGTTFRLPHWYSYFAPSNYRYSKAMLQYQLRRLGIPL
jgi:hypothetical protein